MPDVTVVLLKPMSVSLTMAEPNRRFQLKPTFQNGRSSNAPMTSGNCAWSVLLLYHFKETRPKILSFWEAFQSTRTSPWCARTLVRVSPT